MMKMDAEFKITSRIGIMSTIAKWQELLFNEGGDLRKYIEIHENRADRRVYQLHMSLPPKYDAAMEYYERLDDYKNGEKTYDAYRKKLLEIHKRLSMMGSRPRRQDGHKEERKREADNGKTKELTCFFRGDPEHKINVCPKLSHKDNKHESEDRTSKMEDKKEKPDWTKFKSYRKDDMKKNNTKPMSTTICKHSREYIEEFFQERNKRRSVTEHLERLKLDQDVELSLIHISEPTRPY